jgi:peptidoglycan-N-acetylglucosamine deacetylase
MNARLLTTSWDDGTPEDLALGRLLVRLGFRGTFYATTGPQGSRTISDADLKELVWLGHELGNHGRTHRSFMELSRSELREETSWAQSEIRRFTSPSKVVAPPHGLVSREVISVLNSEGLTVRMAPIIGGGRARAGTLMPTAQLYPHSRARSVLHLVRRSTLPAIPFLRAWCGSKTLRGRLSEIVQEGARRTGVLHIWGHSRELERLRLWRDLELFLEEAAERGFRPVTNGDVAQLNGDS